MFGTIAYVLGETTVDAPNTTPEASDIFRHIGTARRAPKTLTMEVSSHALALDRVGGFAFDLAVWTNLTQDHLDFHKTMEDYYQAKKRLFTEYLKPHGVAAVNIDDEFGKRLVGEISGVPTITFGADQQADVRLAGHTCTWDGTAVEILYQGGTVRFNSSLNGLFNVYNLGMFWAGSRALNRDEAEVAKAATTVPAVKGRIERAKVPTDYTLVVDYAHTPDALEKILVAARSLTKGKLVCVFGCGGDRDRTKRPLMAKTVAQNCDEAVVTSDNPRTEKPTAIIAEVLTGMPLDFPHHVVEDRKEAIRRAMQIARRGDCVVVAGKGHETYQEINGVRHHFDDMEVITDLAGPAQKEIVSV
jgi:UDP-N-acetylmuramoyl-L-alanyl-D-glutamate--2,6-diaminopimelate ligase